MYQVFWYIFKHWKITKQTIYFKYNVYCSSFTKELPRLPPWKNQKWMKLCHILCHICGTCGTPIKCATLCGTCKWDPLDNCNFILYHSWFKVDPFLHWCLLYQCRWQTEGLMYYRLFSIPFSFTPSINTGLTGSN